MLPLDSRVHASLAGPFTLLETQDHQHIAYTETQRRSHLISDRNEISILAQKYAMLRAQALTPAGDPAPGGPFTGRDMSSALNWFKSSYRVSEGGQCLEVAYGWRKSSYSSDAGRQCVEIAAHPAAVHVRDSKDVEGPTFTVAPTAWSAFAAYAATA